MSSLLVLTALRIEAFALGHIEGARVLRTGMGPEHARIAAARAHAIEACSVSVAGLCAGVAPEIRTGDAICASELVTADGSRVALAGSPLLEQALRRRGLRVHVGPLFGATRILGPVERRALPANVLGVDMESAWLADGAAGRPFAVVRVVVDAGDRRLANPRILLDGPRALRNLRHAGSALGEWAAGVDRVDPTGLVPTATAPDKACFH